MSEVFDEMKCGLFYKFHAIPCFKCLRVKKRLIEKDCGERLCLDCYKEEKKDE